MPDGEMRVAVLGSGMMGKRHLEALAGLPRVVMHDITILTRQMEPYATFTDRTAAYQAMLRDPSVDAVDICLPTHLHPWAIKQAFEAGKHILCEKPLALSTGECRQILSEARTSSSIFMVAHVLRFFPAYIHLRRAVRSLQYGRLLSIDFWRESAVPDWSPWLTESAESGGAILDLLIHDFDQSIALLGLPCRISAMPIESAYTVRCQLEYDRNDAPAVHIRGGWFSDGRPFAMGFKAHFEGGVLNYRDDKLKFSSAGKGIAEETIALSGFDPYREQLRYFLACCATHSSPEESPPSESAHAVELSLAVRDLSNSQLGIPSAIHFTL